MPKTWCMIVTYLCMTVCFFERACPVRASDPALVLPDEPRNPKILAPQAFFGFPIGSRHLRHDQVVAYWKHLAETSDRITLIPYGETHGRRPLLVAAVTSSENTRELDKIRQQRPALTTGRYRGELNEELLVMYMGYSVHGDEASAVNAAPLVAYHLCSSESKQVIDWLKAGVYLIDPALNPDGIDRFANWANEVRGRFASASPLDREHVQPWPGGRTNYYWFDLNRDWIPLVHPESQGRLKLFHAWKPNVVLDFHEMSGNSSFFFQPGIPARNNPMSPDKNLELTRTFAAEHAKRMDEADELFFTEERFDDFYAGKGSTYPDLHGAIGILFEQGSTRGLKFRNDRVDRSFGDTVANQVRTSLSSLHAAHENRQELLNFQTAFYADALNSSRRDPKTAYLLVGSPSRVEAAAQLMRRHAIRVYQPVDEIRFEGRTIQSSHLIIVPSNQPEYFFIRSLMEPMQNFRENIFYDVSTWHLPSAFDLDMYESHSDLPEAWLENPWRPAKSPAANEPPWDTESSAVAFAFSPLELGVPALVAALHQIGGRLRVSTMPIRTDLSQGAQEWPVGTFFVLKQANRQRWTQVVNTLKRVSHSQGVPVSPIHSSMTASGPDLGSDTMLQIPRCNPLLLVGSGTSNYSAGTIWHFLDFRMQQPATSIDTMNLADCDLRDFSCVILPSGAYGHWSADQASQIRDYVRQGGTVVAIASAINWLGNQGLINLLNSSGLELDADKPDPEIPNVRSDEQRAYANAEDERALESIAGAFLEVRIDPTHPLAYGFSDSIVPVFRDHSSVFPQPRNSYKVAGSYAEVISGYVSDRNRRRLASSAAVWVEPAGRGRFILIADDPVFRGYVRSSERFLSNAILLGPAIQVPPTAIGSAESEELD